VTHNLSYASILPRLPTRSVRRASGFVQTGFEEINGECPRSGLLAHRNSLLLNLQMAQPRNNENSPNTHTAPEFSRNQEHDWRVFARVG
jgi:hypothetical protein